MYAQKEKSKQNKSRAVANSVAQKGKNVKQGFGFLDNTNVIQRKTHIEHKTEKVTFGTGKSDEVGVKMIAWLDPKKEMVGTSTGSPQHALYTAVQKETTVPMIRGHLLNHDLGGFGVAQNLYPITSSANSKHKTNVENPVGDELFKANNTAGSGIYYEVNVNGVQNTAKDIAKNNASFVCTAYKVTGMTDTSTGTKGAKLIDTEIISNPKKSNTNKKLRGQAIALNGTTLKKTKKKVLPKWDHSGRSGGLIEFNQKFTITAAPNGSAIQKKPLTDYNTDELDAVIGELNSILRDIIEQREDDSLFWENSPSTELLLLIGSYYDFISAESSLKESPLFNKQINIEQNTQEEASIHADKLTEYLGMYLNFMDDLYMLLSRVEQEVPAHLESEHEVGYEVKKDPNTADNAGNHFHGAAYGDDEPEIEYEYEYEYEYE